MFRVSRSGDAAIIRALSAAAIVPILLAAAGCQCVAPTGGTVEWRARYEPAKPSDLPALADDELIAALPAWRQSCAAWAVRTALAPRWAPVCTAIEGLGPAPDPAVLRKTIATCCDAWRIVAEGTAPAGARCIGTITEDRGLMTGYYEPELAGRRAPDDRFRFPLYGVPDDLVTIDLADVVPELRGRHLRGRLDPSARGLRVVPYWSRAELDRGLGARGAELLWVDDRMAAFFVQVQGSGRVRFTDGTLARIGYADSNGQPYRSIGKWLVDRGELDLAQATVPGIEAWALAHPERIDELLEANPSVVFFRELPIGDPALGPAGALAVPLTAGHSLAIDPRFVPLGAPLVIVSTSTDGDSAVRLALGQDTGGAIRGPLRFDLFTGTGAAAGAAAGVQRDRARAWLLLPKGVAPRDLLPAQAQASG